MASGKIQPLGDDAEIGGQQLRLGPERRQGRIELIIRLGEIQVVRPPARCLRGLGLVDGACHDIAIGNRDGLPGGQIAKIESHPDGIVATPTIRAGEIVGGLIRPCTGNPGIMGIGGIGIQPQRQACYRTL